MKQLGNLAIVCARRSDTLLQISNGMATIHIDVGRNRRSFAADWDDDEQINKLIHELNYGELSEKEVNYDAKH